MESLITTGASSVFGAVIGALLTVYTNKGQRTDQNIDRLLEGYRLDNESLKRRVDVLETNREDDRQELSRLQERLSAQGVELLILRAHEKELRGWAREVLAWCGLAMGIIKGLDGTIHDPPPIPRSYESDILPKEPQ